MYIGSFAVATIHFGQFDSMLIRNLFVTTSADPQKASKVETRENNRGQKVKTFPQQVNL